MNATVRSVISAFKGPKVKVKRYNGLLRKIVDMDTFYQIPFKGGTILYSKM